MKQLLLVAAGFLLAVVLLLGAVLFLFAGPTAETAPEFTMELLETVMDNVSWGLSVQEHDEVAEHIERFRADPEFMERMIEYMEENPPPECPCPEMEEWEMKLYEAMGIEPEPEQP